MRSLDKKATLLSHQACILTGMTKKSELSGRLRGGYRSLARFLSFMKKRPPTDEEKLLAAARKIGNDWTEGPYYDEAECRMDSQWRTIIWPHINSCDFTCVVDLAAGHGRNSEKLRHLSQKLYVVDINKENIDFLKNRFRGCKNIVYVQNDGISLGEIGDNEVTLVYSFDAMVHFDSDVVRAYLKEFERILKPGGFGFCHYSNYTDKPTGSYRETSHWRNFMSRELFEHYAWKEGLLPIKSELQDWDGSGRNFDAITLLQKPDGIK